MSAASTEPGVRPEGTYTTALGEFVAGAGAIELPDDLVEWMKLVTLDALGCGLLGATMEWTYRIRETVLATEGSGRSLLWGTGARVSATNAALVNGSAVQGFELDDVGPGSHFGSVTIPVALALADDGLDMSGLDLLRATVVGVEVGARVSDCAGRGPHVQCGFHGPGLFGAFAAAATASYALGLSAELSTHAISTVAQFTSGIMGVHHAGMGKRLLAGKAAHSGTLAAQLARHGFTNVDDIFECGYGSFPTSFNGGRDDPIKLPKLTEGLGEEFKSYLIKFKFWAARGPIHPSLEAIRVIRQEYPFEPNDVERVEVRLPDSSYKAVGFQYRPTSVTAAQMNLQFCLATMILESDVFVEHFTEERLHDPELLEMISRVCVVHDPKLDESPSPKPRDTIVEVHLRNGNEFRNRQNRYLMGFGEAENARHRVVEKFRRATSGVLEDREATTIIDICDHLEDLPDVRQLTDLFDRS